LHDGESAWATSDNLFEAMLLRPKRIGHAFNLFRFPSLLSTLKTNDIALELCPISNQLLGLTPDLRAHTAVNYLNSNVQCTLSSDDPMYFGNDGLSYDFWEVLMGWNVDLAALKKLARNSITYSALDKDSKARLMKYWEAEWSAFIHHKVSELKSDRSSQAALPK
jgi:adenosine deaminase CECR1